MTQPGGPQTPTRAGDDDTASPEVESELLGTSTDAIEDKLPRGGRRGARATGGNTFWLTIERLIHMAVAFIVTIVVARQLGPTEYGRLAIALALLTLLLPISNITAQCLVRDVVTDSKSANALYGAATVASGVVTIGIVFVVFVVVLLTVGIGSSSGIVTMVIVGSALIRPLQVVDAYFLIRLNSKRTVLIRIAALLGTGVFRIALPVLGFSVIWVAWTFVAEAVIGAVGTWWVYRKSENDWAWEVSRSSVSGLLKELAPLLLASSSALIFMRLDQVMLGWLSNLDEAGVFAVSSSLTETPRFPLVALLSSLAPGLVALKQVDRERYLAQLQQLSRLITMLGYVLTLALIVAAPLAPLLLGKAYRDATVIIIILALGTPLACVGGILLYVTNWDKLYRESVIRNGVAAAISVGLNLILLPRYGAIGAAITTLVATLWVYVLGAAFSRRTRYMFFLTVPSLEPVSSTRTLLRYRKEQKRQRAAAEPTLQDYSDL